MIYSEEYKEHIEYTSAAFCKVVLHNAAMSTYRDFRRKQKWEVSLEYLMSETSFEAFTTDTYLEQYDRPTIFVAKGQKIVVASKRLADALLKLNEQRRNVLLLYFFRLFRRSNRKRIWAKQEYSELLEMSGIKTATKGNGAIKT